MSHISKLLVFLVLLNGILYSTAIEEQVNINEYCRAAPEDGKADYSQCLEPSNESNYKIEVVPVVGTGIDLRSEVDIVLYGGDDSKTSPVPISTRTSGTARSMSVKLIDVGAPQQIGVFLRSDSKWKCLRITVWKDYRYWVFSCHGELSPAKRSLTYGVSGNKLYKATVMTGSDGQAGTKGGLEITLIGMEMQTDKILLKQGFYPSTVRRIMFRAADIGELKEISLTNTATDDPWYCDFIRITSEDGKETDFTIRRWIGSPFAPTITASSRPSLGEDMQPQDIECQTRALDIVPRSPEKPITIRVKCPMNCAVEAFGYLSGMSIHPSSASICRSALADNVMSASGGELVVTVVPQIANYVGGHGKHGLVSEEFSPPENSDGFSFYSYMSNSIDHIQSEVRVVDATGTLSHTGRLEVRRNNEWGSICKRGLQYSVNEKAATLACKQLGYNHGFLLESCTYVNGANVCSPRGYPVSLAGINCNGAETDLAQCPFEDAAASAGCDNPINNVAVHCSNFDHGKEPRQGALRILDSTNSPSRTGTGRLEIFINGWGSICSDGWKSSSESVACRQMGYSGVRNGGLSTRSCLQVEGTNICGKGEEPIKAVSVACDGNEHSLMECKSHITSDPYCVHEEDVVVSCDGNGDPTGSQLLIKENPPKIAFAIPYKKYEFSCSDIVSGLQGGPGNAVIVKCPVKCGEASGEVRGSFIYTDDSPVCKAAYHAGIIGNSGGEIVVAFGHEQSEYYGLERNGIISSASGKSARSVTLSKMTQSVQSGETVPFEDIEHEPVNLANPILSWSPNNQWGGFRGRPDDFVDASSLPGGKNVGALSDFTIAARIMITGGQGTWRTILAHTECLGFSLFVDRDNMIKFEQMCNSQSISSRIVPRINEWIFIAVAYRQLDGKVTMYVNGNVVAEDYTNFTFNMRTKLIIGRSSEAESEYFIGQIAHLSIYDTYLAKEEINVAMDRSWRSLQAHNSGGELRGKRHTIDGRQCLTPCQSGLPSNAVYSMGTKATNPAIQLTCEHNFKSAPLTKNAVKWRVLCPPGCGEEKKPVLGTKIYAPKSPICKSAMHMGVIGEMGGEIVLASYPGLNEYHGSAGKNGIISKDEQKQAKSYSVGIAPAARQLTCNDDGNFLFQLPAGERELAFCPPHCTSIKEAKVFGTDTYSPTSSICRAAIHANAISDAGGEVQIEVTPETPRLDGGRRNNIESNSAGYYIRTFRFITA